MSQPMKRRSTYKWWKGLYDLIKTGTESQIMSYVFNRLDQGSFRSQRNSAFNVDAIEFILKEARTGNVALDYVLNEGRKKWEKS